MRYPIVHSHVIIVPIYVFHLNPLNRTLLNLRTVLGQSRRGDFFLRKKDEFTLRIRTCLFEDCIGSDIKASRKWNQRESLERNKEELRCKSEGPSSFCLLFVREPGDIYTTSNHTLYAISSKFMIVLLIAITSRLSLFSLDRAIIPRKRDELPRNRSAYDDFPSSYSR